MSLDLSGSTERRLELFRNVKLFSLNKLFDIIEEGKEVNCMQYKIIIISKPTYEQIEEELNRLAGENEGYELMTLQNLIIGKSTLTVWKKK